MLKDSVAGRSGDGSAHTATCSHMLSIFGVLNQALHCRTTAYYWQLPSKQFLSHFFHNQIMTDEAFPNVDRLLQQAFAAEDPAPLLLQLLKEYPTYPAVRDLVVFYTEAVEEDPYRGQSLASALARVANSPDAPTIESGTLSSLINRELADQHFKVIYGDNEVKEYGPKNTYLLDSLLSGLSLKHKLTSTSDMYAAIFSGLDAQLGATKSEVLVVGACIQLLHGSEIATGAAGSYRRSAEVVASNLKAQKAAGTVKDPHAIQVLEVCNLFHVKQVSGLI